jgi:fructose-1,6-bisphosphatase/inositol monophosphatase family enzyme
MSDQRGNARHRSRVQFDVDAVADIVREVAEAVIMPRWRNLAAHEIERKSRQGDLVTVADHEAEAALSARLGALLPGARVVGEEAVAANASTLDALRGEGVVWVIDPIDGTRKFAAGDPAFDVLVGLVVDGTPVAGWIYAPAERVLFMGEAGGGVRRVDPDGAVSPVVRAFSGDLTALGGIVSGGGFVSRGFADPQGVKHRFREFTKHACAGHNYARLLRGACDFLINFSTLPWDHIAGLALVTEAGFHAARHDGQHFDPLDPAGGLLVAPDAASWREIHGLLLRRA